MVMFVLFGCTPWFGWRTATAKPPPMMAEVAQAATPCGPEAMSCEKNLLLRCWMRTVIARLP
jgi:hypothetical protein